MTYFLDFDRTLFDTSAFLQYIIERDGLNRLMSLSEVEMAIELNAITAKGALAFAPGELKPFMYPDAEKFLKKNMGSCVVITAGNVDLQRAKLESVFYEEPVLPIFYNGEERKGPFIARMLDSYPVPYTFIDDKTIELDSVATDCPDITLYEMRRDGKPGSGRYSVIRSFDELP